MLLVVGSATSKRDIMNPLRDGRNQKNRQAFVSFRRVAPRAIPPAVRRWPVDAGPAIG
jgi:hypothetical protein